jgi:hypothetical protein
MDKLLNITDDPSITCKKLEELIKIISEKKIESKNKLLISSIKYNLGYDCSALNDEVENILTIKIKYVQPNIYKCNNINDLRIQNLESENKKLNGEKWELLNTILQYKIKYDNKLNKEKLDKNKEEEVETKLEDKEDKIEKGDK